MATTFQAEDSMMGGASPAAEPQTHRRCGRRGTGGGRRRFTPGYIAATVIGFVVFPPIGFALLAWGLWREPIRSSRLFQKLSGAATAAPSNLQGWMARHPGNSALSDYLAREQERLRAEQVKLDELVKAFDAFKEAERRNADQRDFDAFLQQRGADAGVTEAASADRDAGESAGESRPGPGASARAGKRREKGGSDASQET